MKQIKTFLFFGLLVCVCIGVAARGDITHRYSFDDPNDKIGTADGILINNTGNAEFTGGQLVLGNDGGQSSDDQPLTGDYFDLPNGIISGNGDNATFEYWVTWNGPEGSNWQEFSYFGMNWDGFEDRSTGGGTYVAGIPRSGDSGTGNAFRVTCRNNDLGYESWVDDSSQLTIGHQEHVVIVWDGDNDEFSVYRNGSYVGTTPALFDLSTLDDRNSWLGRSGWNDTMFVGGFNEFRIYNSLLDDATIATHFNLGTDNMPVGLVAPAQDAFQVDADQNLFWDASPVTERPVTNYVVYLGNDETTVANATTSTVGIYRGTYDNTTFEYEPGTLVQNMDYYWRIDQIIDDEFTDPNTLKGTVWHFDTKTVPVFVAPFIADEFAPEGKDGSFSVAVTSSTAVSFEWFKDGTGAIIDDDIKYDIVSDALASMLTIHQLEAADEGDYYCVATNTAGPVASDMATLTILTMIAHYELETAVTETDPNVYDSSGFDNNGTAYGDPALVTGLVGTGAYEFDGNDYIQIPRMIQDSFTISLWVKTEQTISATDQGWWNGAGFVNGEMPGVVDDFGVQLLGSKACAAVRDVQITSEEEINDNQWHHVAMTRERPTGELRIYVDGGKNVSATATTASLTAPTALTIGKQLNGTGYFIGQIDEVRIYEYAMDEFEVADYLYLSVRPDDSVCIQKPEFDLNDDCIVDIEDFLMVIDGWLDCGYLPETACL